MTLSISLVAVLGIAVWILVRYAGMRLLHAVTAILFGFYLSETLAAPEIKRIVSALLSGLHF